jgi:hypothetical protein
MKIANDDDVPCQPPSGGTAQKRQSKSTQRTRASRRLHPRLTTSVPTADAVRINQSRRSGAMAEPAPARIELTRVGKGCWRLCDPALHESDPRRLVAFVECAEDHVTVLWLRDTHADTRFDTLEDALAAADSLLAPRARRAVRAQRPVPIPHFPPRAR